MFNGKSFGESVVDRNKDFTNLGYLGQYDTNSLSQSHKLF